MSQYSYLRKVWKYTMLSILITIFGSSCVKENKSADVFVAKFMLLSDQFHNGDEFGFSIQTNRSQFKVTKFSFPLDPNMVSVNTTYSTTDGIWTIRKPVVVPTSQRGKVAITIMDIDTGLERDFEAIYTAYASSNMSIIIENEIITNNSYNRDRLPCVVDGDDFVFTITSRAETMVLNSFVSEFNDGSLSEGKTLNFVDGKLTFRIPKVSTHDGFSPKELKLTIFNPDTSRDTTIRASYITFERFAPSAKLINENLEDGGIGVLELKANRQNFVMTKLTVPTWCQFKNLPSGDSENPISLDLDNSKTYDTYPFNIITSENGIIYMELADRYYTNRRVVLEVPYRAIAKNAPGSINLSTQKATLRESENLTVTISTNDTHSTGVYRAKVYSGNTASIYGIYSPSKNNTTKPEDLQNNAFEQEVSIIDGKLYIRATGEGGDVTVRVYSDGNEKVYKDIVIHTRQTVALRIKGVFTTNYYNDNPNKLRSEFHDLNNEHKLGWDCYPTEFDASLVKFTTNSSGASQYKDFSIIPLTGYTSKPLNVTFLISVGSVASSTMFYGAYKHLNPPQYGLIDWAMNNNVSFPSSREVFITETTSNGASITCQKTLSLLQDMDGNCWYQIHDGLFNWGRSMKHGDDCTKFGSFELKVTSLTYDTDNYYVKYIMNLCEVDGEHGTDDAWWHGLSGNRPWLTTWEK